MRKTLKILLIILIAVSLIAGGLAIWQRKNIESILIGLREDSTQIDKRRNDNQTNLVDDVNTHLDTPLREMTVEEKEKLESGETTASEIYQKMFEEKMEEAKENKPQEGTQKKPEGETASTAPKESKDEIVSRYMVELYKLQTEFNARAEATIKEGGDYYESINAHPQDPVARAETITRFTPIVRGIEKECDGRFEEVLKKLEGELKSAGYDTAVIPTIRRTYQNEKQLKLSYYANKYLK